MLLTQFNLMSMKSKISAGNVEKIPFSEIEKLMSAKIRFYYELFCSAKVNIIVNIVSSNF